MPERAGELKKKLPIYSLAKKVQQNKSEPPQEKNQSKKKISLVKWTLSCYSEEQKLDSALKQLGKRCLALSKSPDRLERGLAGCAV